MMKKTMMADTV